MSVSKLAKLDSAMHSCKEAVPMSAAAVAASGNIHYFDSFFEVASASATTAVPEKSFATEPLHPNVSRSEFFWAFATLYLCGATAMVVYNALLSSLFSVEAFVYPDYPSMSDTLTAVYVTFALASVSIMIYTGAGKFLYFCLGSLGFAMCAILFAIASTVCSGKAGVVFMHIVQALSGTCTGLFESPFWAIASVMPGYNYCGPGSFGMGMSGIITWALWMLFSKAFFKMNARGVKGAVWAFYIIAAALNIASFLLMRRLVSRPWVKEAMEMAEVQRRRRTRYDSVLGSQRSRWEIFKSASGPILSVGVCCFVTYLMFPNVAPYAWGDTVVHTDVLMGLWHASGFCGRYIPLLRSKVRFITLPPRHLWLGVLFRACFVPLLWGCFKWAGSPFFGSFGMHVVFIILFAGVEGWVLTQGNMYVPECVPTESEKSLASTMNLLGLLLGITIGIWTAKLWKL